jgi:hypothetical protein
MNLFAGFAFSLLAMWLARKGFRLVRMTKRAPDSEWREEKEHAAQYTITLAVFAGAAAVACFLGG